MAERRSVRLALGTLSEPLVARRLHAPLGFRSLGDYARERLGMSSRVVREWARVAGALRGLPRLRAALASGEVSWSVARRAVAHATPETDAAFVDTLRGRTVRAAEAMLAAVFGTGADTSLPTEAPSGVGAATGAMGVAGGGVPVRVRMPLAAAHRGLWSAALELARRTAGEPLPAWECAEALAADALASLPAERIAEAAGARAERGSRRRPGPAREPGASEAATARDGAAAGRHGEPGSRHEAFPIPRWDPLPAAAALGSGAQAPWAAAASPHALDQALRRIVARMQRIEHDLGQLLRHVGDHRLHRELGFASFARYAEERVDVSARTARRWVRFARLGPAGSPVANALRAGTLTSAQASRVAESAAAGRQEPLVEFAAAVTLRRLEDEVGAGDGAWDGGSVAFTAPPEAANVFLLAVEAVRLELAHRCGRRVGPGPALVWMLQSAVSEWMAQGAEFRDYADFVRDGFRCTVPGCTARRNLQSHHVRFRSAGGPDEGWNRTTLCAFHHLRGVHAGVVTCKGRAPDGLRFALGVRASGAPLLRASSGDVLLR